ncbi:phytanoyl-CoA dioxygenase family protein, partial [Methylibium sp. T29-B]|uniref:phytanoyl-CoA dioxygenase family protein n=1 Tax=Methylibium sp. T29-B TaxID=1437443 RepID=UPI001E3F7AB7
MQLSTDQLARYRRDGFIVLPELLAPAEVAAMKAELQRLQGIDTDHLVRERVGGVAKTIYRVHEADGPTASPPFHAAARAPRCSPRPGNCSATSRSTSTMLTPTE